MNPLKVKRALISVFDKTGLLEFAGFLQKNQVEILSTGGTFKALKDAGIPCIAIEEFTGQKEIFGGRVKTLHPLIHGGILSKRDAESDALGMKTIDLVVVNLYPFEEIVKKGEKRLEELIEMIDIGGPTMLRSCSKNYLFACPVCKPDYYQTIMNEMQNGGITYETRLKMALEVFKTTAYYDGLISTILSETQFNENPVSKMETTVSIPLIQSLPLRYGENPHQSASFYAITDYPENQISAVYTDGKLHGKELSYNNIADISSAFRILRDLDNESCVVIKHSNPCGAATRKNTHESFLAAYEGDKVSIFGGIVGFKGVVGKDTALIMKDIFLEIIIAENFTDEAMTILTGKKNIRLIAYGKLKNTIFTADRIPEMKRVIGGVLLQSVDTSNPRNEEIKTVTRLTPNEAQLEDMIFAQILVKHVKSNGIVVVKDKMLLGVGAGQMNRVTSARIALDWAGEKSKGAVLGSDAFFPMDDTVRLAAHRGISAIIQPGGSLKDEDSIKACDELEIPMVFTGVRHFLH